MNPAYVYPYSEECLGQGYWACLKIQGGKYSRKTRDINLWSPYAYMHTHVLPTEAPERGREEGTGGERKKEREEEKREEEGRENDRMSPIHTGLISLFVKGTYSSCNRFCSQILPRCWALRMNVRLTMDIKSSCTQRCPL